MVIVKIWQYEFADKEINQVEADILFHEVKDPISSVLSAIKK